jgi:hypothetical protein
MLIISLTMFFGNSFVKVSRWRMWSGIALALCSTIILAAEQPQVVPEEGFGGVGFDVPEGALDGGELIFQQQDDPVLVSPDATTYQFYIADLESREGPYAPGLAEQLLGLGVALQEQGLHGEAVKVFKRGVHLSRINTGLYSSDQIPLLQRQISSHIANREYEAADERQYYLYRVQRKLYQPGAPQLSSAMLQRAEWQRQAYFLSIGEVSFTRLLSMWDLYSRALSNIAQNEGSYSNSLLQPLTGLLETQYLISSYTGEASGGFEMNGGDQGGSANEGRFTMVRLSNYKQGQAVINAMHEVYTFNEPESSPLPAETTLLMGDWHLWHRKGESAIGSYQQAWDQLATLPDGERTLQQVFATPILLPNGPDSTGELEPPAEISGYAEVSYSIDERGRVIDLELLSAELLNETSTKEPTRLMRRIKGSIYRPRFENREPVATEVVAKRYAY